MTSGEKDNPIPKSVLQTVGKNVQNHSKKYAVKRTAKSLWQCVNRTLVDPQCCLYSVMCGLHVTGLLITGQQKCRDICSTGELNSNEVEAWGTKGAQGV